MQTNNNLSETLSLLSKKDSNHNSNVISIKEVKNIKELLKNQQDLWKYLQKQEK